jgi:NAD(P)-dependent dehydrogenase (short-subunit alcohol dehydrogenase family)
MAAASEATVASKAGLLALTRSMAAEGASRDVRINAVSPVPANERFMSQQLGRSLAERAGITPEQILAGASEGILRGRPQTAAEIAVADVFLVSDQVSAIAGQTLNVDGGMAFC